MSIIGQNVLTFSEFETPVKGKKKENRRKCNR